MSAAGRVGEGAAVNQDVSAQIRFTNQTRQPGSNTLKFDRVFEKKFEVDKKQFHRLNKEKISFGSTSYREIPEKPRSSPARKSPRHRQRWEARRARSRLMAEAADAVASLVGNDKAATYQSAIDGVVGRYSRSVKLADSDGLIATQNGTIGADYQNMSNSYRALTPTNVSLPPPGAAATVSLLPFVAPGSYAEANVVLPREERPAATHRAQKGCRPGDYRALLGMLKERNMIRYLEADQVRAVNGLFGVNKSDESVRLIIDARTANGMMRAAPNPDLPSPASLCELELPPGEKLWVGKSDLADYYHRLQLPPDLVPYFALPPVASQRVGIKGAPRLVYPCCTSLCMGWSHSVYLAQRVHRAILMAPGVLDNVIWLGDGKRKKMKQGYVYGILYIDDLVLFSTSLDAADAALSRALAAYQQHGLPAKPSKVQRPGTATTTTVLGIDVHENGVVTPNRLKLEALRYDTLRLVRRGFCSPKSMQRLVGRWTWVLLLVRPSLSLLSAVYAFGCQQSRRALPLWNNVKKELMAVAHLAPVLHRTLGAATIGTVLASDASSYGLGVVYASAGENVVRELDEKGVPELVKTLAWRTAIACKHKQLHINHAELLAAKLALEWAAKTSNRRGALTLLCDSTVATGILRKGRTKSYRLRNIMKNVLFFVLVFSVHLRVLWVSTDHNPADKPSRK